MFDIGFSEVLIIAVVALLVLGPERLPKAARFAGLWVRRARAQWYSVKAEFEREIAQEELMRQVREPFAEAMAETGAQMRALDAELSAPYIATKTLAAAAPGETPSAPIALESPVPDEALESPVPDEALESPVADAAPDVPAVHALVAVPDAESEPLQGDLLAPLEPAAPPLSRDPDPLGVARP